MYRLCSIFHICIKDVVWHSYRLWFPRNTVCWVTYMLSIRLTVTWFYVPFVPYWRGHVDLNLNVNWLGCHICRQLYCQPWDEQRYLSYRHVLVSLLTAIGGEALSNCGFVALCCWCVQFRTVVCKIPALMVKLPLCLVSFHIFVYFTQGLNDQGVMKTITLLNWVLW